MPIKATKPSKEPGYRGTTSKPGLGDFKTESEGNFTGKIKQEIQEFNEMFMTMTQPYGSFTKNEGYYKGQQEDMIRRERIGAPPPRGSRRWPASE